MRKQGLYSQAFLIVLRATERNPICTQFNENKYNDNIIFALVFLFLGGVGIVYL